MDYDVIIIGAGVVGLACSVRIAQTQLRTLVIERHPSFGYETSSRNSEVVHAGIYYPNNSLKAKLCVAGNKSIYKWAEMHDVAFKRMGKYIIATDSYEDEQLEKILENAKTNGVENIYRKSLEEIKRDEPNLKAIGAIWSGTSGIIDSHALMKSFQTEASRNGCDFAYNHEVVAIEFKSNCYELTIKLPDSSYFTVTSKWIVNSAGLDADRIAEMAGIDIEKAKYRLHYCKGHYFRVASSKIDLVRHLIYPAPPKDMTSLGIHITLDLNGEMKLGPDTEYLDSRVQDYSVPQNLNEKFYRAVTRYLIGLNIEDISPDQAGIRPKLQAEGEAVRDFVICEESGKNLPFLINLIGIESPGLTSCLEIADLVANIINSY